MRSLDLSCPRLSGANISDLAEQASASGIWEIDLVTDTVRGTSQFFRNMGLQPTEQPVPMTLLRSLRPSDDRQRIDRGYVETVAQGADLYESEYRIHRANDGAERWILGRGKVTRDARGVPISYSGVDIDITDRKRAELALADSEARLKLAVIAGNIGIWDWNLATGEMTYSPEAKAICGFPANSPVTYEQVRDITDARDLPRTSAMAARALDPEIRERTPYEYRIVRPDGVVRWVSAHGEATFATVEGVERATRYTGTIQDITERRLMEEHREFLTSELVHRTKNILGLVRAIAVQTFDRATEGDRLNSFVSRLVALGNAHDLLMGERSREAELREILEAALQPHGLLEGRFDIEGPPLLLTPRRGLTMSLALNELATNAAKYGALSQSGGRVRIRWTKEEIPEGKLLVFKWSEIGGPPATNPERQGFGSKIIGQQLPAEFGGSGSLQYKSSGLEFELRAPWPVADR